MAESNQKLEDEHEIKKMKSQIIYSDQNDSFDEGQPNSISISKSMSL